MAHIQINVGGRAASSVLLDGVDITRSILGDSLSVDVRDDGFSKSLVHLTLLADVVGIDIEDVEFDAQRVEAPRRLCDPRDNEVDA